MAASRSRIPPWRPAPRALVCRFTKFTFSTMTRPLSRSTFRMRPDLPRSSPEITITWSFFRKLDLAGFTTSLRGMSDHLRSERNDLHELPLAKLARHRTEDARSLGFLLVVDQHGRVLVEADVGAVLAADFLPRPDQDRLVHVALLHGRSRKRVLDGDHDDVPEHAVAFTRAAQDLHDPRDARARVVRYGDDAPRLYHGSFPLPLTFPASTLHALDEIDQAPALVLAEGPRLHEADDVPHLALVLLVVNLEPAAAPDVLPVFLVLHQTLDGHDHGFLHRVADDAAGHELASSPLRRLFHQALFAFLEVPVLDCPLRLDVLTRARPVLLLAFALPFAARFAVAGLAVERSGFAPWAAAVLAPGAVRAPRAGASAPGAPSRRMPCRCSVRTVSIRATSRLRSRSSSGF